MLTEQTNPRTQNIDQSSTLEILQIMNDEDVKVAQVVRQALPAIARAVDAIEAAIESQGRLIYIGAGTSGRLGVMDAAECVPTFGTSPDLVIGLIAGGEQALVHAVEGAEDRAEDGRRDLERIILNKNDVVVGIAASGHTPYVLEAIRYAGSIGAITVGIACNNESPLFDIAQIGICLPVGSEVIAGSTRLKAGTAQKMVLNMLSTATMVKLGKVYGNQMVDVQVTNDKLAQRAARIVADVSNISVEDAKRLLAFTDNRVKEAIVVHVKQVTLDEARKLLQAAGGQLRAVIG